MSASLLDVQHVMRGYGARSPVLTDVSLTVQREEIVALLGRNGAGKSTLVYLALGLLAPERGTVRTFGLDPVRDPVAVKRRIGFVGEQPTAPPMISGADLLALHRTLYPAWDRTFERDLVERFALGPHLGKSMGLSKGQRQQLALLCAVCHRPELLVLDEPAAGLDPVARREFLEASIQLLNREGTGIVYSSHHLGDVERLGGRMLLLDEGRIKVDAALDVLREARCLVTVPRDAVSAERMHALPGLVRLRAVGDRWHALITGEAAMMEPQVQAILGTPAAWCTALPLEDLFIEVTAGTSAERAA
jgi:ABC-2 type transport system ATP-binding protein